MFCVKPSHSFNSFCFLLSDGLDLRSFSTYAFRIAINCNGECDASCIPANMSSSSSEK